MAWYPELRGPTLEARSQAIDELLRRAQKELNLARSELVIRPLRPNDLGNTGGTWETISVGTTSSELHNVTIADNSFVSIYGFHFEGTSNDEASTAADRPVEWRAFVSGRQEPVQRLQISRAGSTAREWTINMIPSFRDKTGYVDDPILVDQNTNLTTNLFATVASTLRAVSYAFLGDVVERKGLTINP